ncbi:MAG TPA: sugar transferase [Anaerolineaceae bacterium]|nr:sugar transferase [Anaerolineaceae bacterium]
MGSVTSEDYYETSSQQADRELVQRRPVVFNTFKRVCDIVFSLLGLLVLAPVLLFIALRIKRDSPGPAFFSADRMGRKGKVFKIWKFRTMFETPQNHHGAPVTSSEDSRVTPYGRWLRDTKLNELPQLLNVLKGEMSFVGPRPEDVQIASNWPEAIREEVLSVRPGVTSPASIIYRNEEKMLKGSGFLDDYLRTILPDKLRLDQLYVRNMNVLTDMDVLAMTLVTLIPALRQKDFDERWMYGGPFFLLFKRVLGWFLIDVLVTLFSVGLSGAVWRISAVINLGIPTFALVSLAVAVLLSLINLILGLSKVDWTKASPVFTIDLAFSSGVTMAIIWAVNRFWLTTPWIPFSLIWLIWLTIFIGLVTARYQERLLTGLANRWLLLRGTKASFAERILIVGAGDLGELTIWLLNRSAYATLFGVVGIVDDDAHKRGSQILGLNVIGGTNDIPKLVKKFGVGLIFFAIANVPAPRREELIQLCEGTGIRTVIVPDLVKVLERSIKKIEVAEQHES